MENIKIDKLIRSKRRTIALIVTPEATLTVRAPMRTSMDYIKRVVSRKSLWITRKIEEIKARTSAAQKEFVTGETFLYLGKPHALRLLSGSNPPLAFSGEFLLSTTQKLNARELLLGWYKKEALKIISERVEFYAHATGIRYEKVKVNSAVKRWGSCSTSGNLNFTWRLVMAPVTVIDYVVVHELAHIEIKNHSKNFWAKVRSICPDYEASKKWLKQNSSAMKL